MRKTLYWWILKVAALMRALIENFQENYLHKLDDEVSSRKSRWNFSSRKPCICKVLKYNSDKYTLDSLDWTISMFSLYLGRALFIYTYIQQALELPVNLRRWHWLTSQAVYDHLSAPTSTWNLRHLGQIVIYERTKRGTAPRERLKSPQDTSR